MNAAVSARAAPPGPAAPRRAPWISGRRPDGAPSRRTGIVATIANVGGLALGPLMAGALAQYVAGVAGGLTLTFVVLLAALVVAAGLAARSPEGRETVHPRPSYRP